MNTDGFPDLVEVLINAGGVAPALVMLLQGIAAIIGLYLVSGALVELWGVSHDNALKYVAGRQRFSVGSALVSKSIVAAKDWAALTRLAADYIAAAKAARAN